MKTKNRIIVGTGAVGLAFVIGGYLRSNTRDDRQNNSRQTSYTEPIIELEQNFPSISYDVLEQLVDFCGVQILKQDRDIFYEIFKSAGKNPENYYKKNNKGNIMIENHRIVFICAYGTGLKNLPESIEDLKSLEVLSVWGNQLTNLPESIEDLKSLKEFYVHNNQLTNLPESIEDLKSLKELSVFNNQLTTKALKILDKLEQRGVVIK